MEPLTQKKRQPLEQTATEAIKQDKAVQPPTEQTTSQATMSQVKDANKSAEWGARITRIYQELLSFCSNQTDIVRFAQYLDFKGYVRSLAKTEATDPRKLLFSVSPSFCNIQHIQFACEDYKASRLGQCYFADLFPDPSYADYIRVDISVQHSVSGWCKYCKLCAPNSSFSICPYRLAALIQFVARHRNCGTDLIYRILLKDKYTSFSSPSNITVPPEIATDLVGIDSKSAYAAFLLIQSRWFTVINCTNTSLSYCYLSALCRKDYKDGLIDSLVAYWNNGIGDTGIIKPRSQHFSHIKYGHRYGDFKQRPEQLAAYFSWLGQKYNIDALNLAYYTATHTTVSQLSLRDQFQYDRFTSGIEKFAFIAASKDEYIKVLRYIVNRKQNKSVPFIPFNFVVHSTDEKLVDDFCKDFTIALRFFDYFKNSYSVELSVLSMAEYSFTELITKYREAQAGTVFHLKQIELLTDTVKFPLNMAQLLKIMKERKDVFTVVSGKKETLESFFAEYSEMYHQVLSYHIYDAIMPEDTVFDLLVEQLEVNYTLPSDFKHALEEYVHTQYASHELNGNPYIDWLKDTIIFNHFNCELGVTSTLLPRDVPFVEPRRTEEDIFKELNQLVGLNTVKETLQNVNDLVKYFMKTNQNMSSRPNLHMVFAGNAGTGKTTVARLIAEILHSIGFIRQNKLVICSGKDLIGQYIGVSQHLVAEKCEQAYDGVLFIDEAYLLNPFTSGTYVDTYKQDAVNELIQQMESNRDRLIVIFAGYTKEMDDFVKKSNPGLESRIAYTIPFPDYNLDELATIFKNTVQRKGLSITSGAEQRAVGAISRAMLDVEHFGNARFVRTMFEKIEIQHARNTRNVEADDPELYVLSEQDIPHSF